MNDSIKLAMLWLKLDRMKTKIDSIVIPVAGHLSLEDPELIEALETLSEKIGEHFKKFKLVATPIKVK